MLKHAFVPEELAYGIIIPLLKDTHGDSSKIDMYRGITLSPAVSKLFEHVVIKLYEGQLGSDHLQFGFKKKHGCVHALFTFWYTKLATRQLFTAR